MIAARHLVYDTARLRAIEAQAVRQPNDDTLMRCAARAAYTWVCAHIALLPTHHVLILVGPGNNGGDALHLARLLLSKHPECAVDLAVPFEHALLHTLFSAKERRTLPIFPTPQACLASGSPRYDLIVDGLFGIGLSRPPEGIAKAWIALCNHLHDTNGTPLLALDIPSGLHSDTGQCLGGYEATIHASHTLTFIAHKPGLWTGAGRDCAGHITLDTLCVPEDISPLPGMTLLDADSFQDVCLTRAHDSHKGRFGTVGILGGATGMLGAPILAARAALHAGAGKIHVGFLDAAPQFDPLYPELMLHEASATLCDLDVLVVGPGLGQSRKARLLLASALHSPTALVLDADALNLIALHPDLAEQLCRHPGTHILTPHPLEAARLLGESVHDVQQDRLNAARRLASRYGAHVVLKGSGSVVCSSAHELYINTSGNALLATAGSGDLLSGIIAALLAQKLNAIQALTLGVWLHGAGADTLKTSSGLTCGATSQELLVALRKVLNTLSNPDCRNGINRPYDSSAQG